MSRAQYLLTAGRNQLLVTLSGELQSITTSISQSRIEELKNKRSVVSFGHVSMSRSGTLLARFEVGGGGRNEKYEVPV